MVEIDRSIEPEPTTINKILDPIKFYSVTDEYGEFSNFYENGDGSGKNMLGIVLMKIREELLQELIIDNRSLAYSISTFYRHLQEIGSVSFGSID